MKKKHQVVMIPATNLSSLYTIPFVLKRYDNSLIYDIMNPAWSTKPQCLYILSDDEIKPGDWYFYKGVIYKALIHASEMVLDAPIKKIIATTDKSLGLPQISTDFIKQYCERGGINKVMVEYWAHTEEDIQYKVSSDNTISIKPIKDSWSREEVVELIRQYNAHIFNTNDEALGPYQFNHWIKENL